MLRRLRHSAPFWSGVLGFSVVMLVTGIVVIALGTDRATLDVGIVLGAVGSAGLVLGLGQLQGALKRGRG